MDYRKFDIIEYVLPSFCASGVGFAPYPFPLEKLEEALCNGIIVVVPPTALADADCTTIQIASITGHSLKSVEGILEHYVAGTRKQADTTIYKLENARIKKSANQVANHGKNQRGDQKLFYVTY